MAHRLWTIGHSTHALDELAALLARHGIEALVDVRTVPRSRRHPHFASDALARSLPERNVEYRHFPGLGGFRRPRPDSPNGGWRNDSFRGYADYALTEEFGRALEDLCAVARERRTAAMCSEGLWWRCHRRLISDRLVVTGWEVCHIGPDGSVAPHELADFALPQPDGTILYPPAQTSLL